ncbi:BEND2 protein, partial [Panurus biarmicus]|nr:BEND2 protein [Panurus biarmicus]
MRTREEYEDSDSVIYEYEPDYECVSKFSSILSEASYTGYQQNPLMEVLNYCQAMYDAIQRLDKKFDLLHRKVLEMQHTRIKPLLLKPGRHSPPVRVPLQNGHVQVNSKVKHTPQSFQLESQQPAGRQSPPLPTIVSTHSLHSSYTATNGMPDLSPQSNLTPSVVESTVNVASSPVASPSIPAPSEPSQENKAFVGDPARNVKVLGNHLVKAQQKTKPKYAARHLVRVLFPKKTLLCSIMGASARGRRTLDPNKIAAIREFLATNFPTYDLSEHGKDWKTCITNVNSMIRSLRSETKGSSASSPKVIYLVLSLHFFSQINYLASSWYKCCIGNSLGSVSGKEKVSDAPDTSHCVDLNYNEDNGVNSQNSQKMTGSTTDTLQNLGLDNKNIFLPSMTSSLEPLGSPWRNVQLPFSVIYVAKGKTRPELSARYLIRHMFPEDVLVKSNVYGSLDRGMSPLDSNKINALRDFLQENFPSFDLNESGFDWKACVAAINSTIRSLRHELKKATSGI